MGGAILLLADVESGERRDAYCANPSSRRDGPPGDEIYERDIRHQVEADHHGEVVAIDVDSGNWAIGDDVIAATDQLWAQHPAAHDIWSVRVGYRAWSASEVTRCGGPNDRGRGEHGP